jgi:hypothetical protein
LSRAAGHDVVNNYCECIFPFVGIKCLMLIPAAQSCVVDYSLQLLCCCKLPWGEIFL